MRDYPNGGFFFIDVASIQAAGEDGLKIDGIFEDAKRAIEGGKVFVLTGVTLNDTLFSGIVAIATSDSTIAVNADTAEGTVTVLIKNSDIVTFAD